MAARLAGSSPLFRSLPDRLKRRVKSIPGWRDFTYRHGRQGNFTLITINNPNDSRMYFGIAKRDPNSDGEDYWRGFNIAGSRAVRSMLRDMVINGEEAEAIHRACT